MQITYLFQAAFVAVALAAPAPQGGAELPTGVFPSGLPSGTGGPIPTGTGGPIPTGTGLPFPSGTGGPIPTGTGLPFPSGGEGGHDHTGTRSGDETAPTGFPAGGDEGSDE
ncbi:hypothetical protein VE03_00325 [Pseudogymnoascus sp. 23342-1-I1]|nr:hypothetical protein VE03_00325 [Pseudogymnoascus sp. 23342-1-I1]